MFSFFPFSFSFLSFSLTRPVFSNRRSVVTIISAGFKPALWIQAVGPPVFSLYHGHDSRIESLVHHHSITTSPALSIDNVSAVLHSLFDSWLASRQRISIRTGLCLAFVVFLAFTTHGRDSVTVTSDKRFKRSTCSVCRKQKYYLKRWILSTYFTYLFRVKYGSSVIYVIIKYFIFILELKKNFACDTIMVSPPWQIFGFANG